MLGTFLNGVMPTSETSPKHLRMRFGILGILDWEWATSDRELQRQESNARTGCCRDGHHTLSEISLDDAIPSNAETQNRASKPFQRKNLFRPGPSVRRTGPRRWHPAHSLVTDVAECPRVVFDVSLLVNMASAGYR